MPKNTFPVSNNLYLTSKQMPPQIPEEYEIDPGVLSLLQRPKVLNPEDDHFNAPALDGKWTLYGAPALDFTTLPGWLGITNATGTGIVQPVPSGDWTIETEAITLSFTGTTGAGEIELFLSTSTNPASMTGAIMLFYRDGVTSQTIQFQKLVNNSFSAQYTGSPLNTQTPYVNHWFFRINKASTTYRVDVSDTGKQWYRLFQETSLGFTPSYFGIRNGGYYNYFIRR